jgi:hypothetical protein
MSGIFPSVPIFYRDYEKKTLPERSEFRRPGVSAEHSFPATGADAEFDCYTDRWTINGEPMPRGKTTQHHRSSTDNGYWSAEITHHSNALDLEHNVFTWRDPKRIARSLKSSAEASERRKANPYQSAMSMLNFYINRAGKSLSRERKQVLDQAKIELRRLFGRT